MFKELLTKTVLAALTTPQGIAALIALYLTIFVTWSWKHQLERFIAAQTLLATTVKDHVDESKDERSAWSDALHAHDRAQTLRSDEAVRVLKHICGILWSAEDELQRLRCYDKDATLPELRGRRRTP